MRKYSTRRNRGAIPFEVDGVAFHAKPVLEMAARIDLTVIDFEIQSMWDVLRKEQRERTQAVTDGDKDALLPVLEWVQEQETAIRAKVIEAACIMIDEADQDRFGKAALEDWDDITLYEIFVDLKKQAQSTEEVMSQDLPTKR